MILLDGVLAVLGTPLTDGDEVDLVSAAAGGGLVSLIEEGLEGSKSPCRPWTENNPMTKGVQSTLSVGSFPVGLYCLGEDVALLRQGVLFE
jgi:hypothetical protein